MTILLIGGTGTISTEITKRCAALGWDVALLNRGKQNGRLPDDIRVRFLQADINDESSAAALLKDLHFDVVANFINYTPAQVERDIRLFKGKTGQYIFISSASAYQKPPAHYYITESTPLVNPYWEYSRQKIACEDVLIKAYRENAFPITIVRPSHTYDVFSLPVGLHGANGSWQVIRRILEKRPILVQGDGSSLWTLTHSRDFAKGFTGLMGNIHAIGEAVHITSDESLTWNQIYMAIGNALGVEPILHHVATDYICKRDPSYIGPLLGDKAVTVVFDNSKIKRLVPEFICTTRFEQGARESIEWMETHPEAQNADPDFDAWCDRVIKAHEAGIREFFRLSGN